MKNLNFLRKSHLTNFYKNLSSKSFSKIIGIDLGTTNSCVSVMEGGAAKVIENNEGMRTTPSVVAFVENDSQLVGLPAKRQSVTNPSNTFHATKRLIGRRFDDKETQAHIKTLSYKVVKADNGDAWVETSSRKKYSPSQIAAFVLQKLKETAEGYLNSPVTEAVITVPAYFNDSQRQATKDAGRIAGLDVKKIINEPTAAALAYGIDKSNENKVVAVYDLGGGTFDISILELNKGVFEVKSTNGDTLLGGEDFDATLQKYVLEEFKNKHKVDISDNQIALQRIKEAAEKAKIELSSVKETTIDLPFLYVDKTGPKNLKINLTREKLESLVSDLLKRTLKPCENCLRDSKLKKENIDEVLLVGGMTRMPKVQEMVKNFFGREPSKTVNPDEAVAMGAAIQGGVLKGEYKDVVLIDVTPLSLGTDSVGDIFVRIINRNTTVPCKQTHTFTTVQDAQTAVSFGIYQGEREIASQNKLLGKLSLENIPIAPKGIPKIEVTFELDANGILHVSAMDRGTQKRISTTIQAKGGLNEYQINEMIKQAEAMRKSDMAKKELISLKNEAETLIYDTNKMIEGNKDRIKQESLDEVNKQIANVKETLDKNGDNLEIVKGALDAFRAASMNIGKEIYEANASQNSEKKQ
jgi:molecular chaperone DnaK